MSIRPQKALLNPELTRPSALDSIPRDPGLIWLDKNENLDPELTALSHEVLEGIPSSILSTYPEAAECYRKLGEWCDVPPECLLLTPGSDGAIRLTFEAFVEAGDPVVHTDPTFAMYPVYSQMFGADNIPVSYARKDDRPFLDPGMLIDAVRKHSPKLLCLPNPDSPTGTVLEQYVLRELLECCASTGTAFLVDEAYHPFYERSVVPWVEEYPNLIVARTFAKAWGLAGLRVGYAVACADTITLLHKMRPMYEVSSLAVEMVARMFEHQDEMARSVTRMRKAKTLFGQAMRDLGFGVLDTEGNFIHVAFGDHGDRVHETLEGKVYYRKAFNQPCLAGYTRFSIGSGEVMEQLAALIKSAVKDISK